MGPCLFAMDRLRRVEQSVPLASENPYTHLGGRRGEPGVESRQSQRCPLGEFEIGGVVGRKSKLTTDWQGVGEGALGREQVGLDGQCAEEVQKFGRLSRLHPSSPFRYQKDVCHFKMPERRNNTAVLSDPIE